MVFGLARKVYIRKTLIVACCAAIVAVLTLGIAKIIKKGVNAAEGNVSVVYDRNKVIPYGTGGSSTYIFSIDANTGRHLGFCGDPGDTPPSGGTAVLVDTSGDQAKRILLAAYAYIDHSGLIRRMLPNVDVDDVETQYGWLHSIIAYFHTNGSNDGVHNGADRAVLNNAISVLENEIRTNGQAWVNAQSYNLYSVSGGPGFQTMYWIEPKPEEPRGSIIVTKKDATTHSTTPQGNASFNGIKFIVKQGQTEKGSCTLAGDSATCTIENLEYGEYTIWEANGVNGQATHPSYEINVETSKPATVNSNTPTTVVFEDEVRKGSVTVRKKDAKMQDGECKTTSGHSFNGITFSIYLSSGNKNPIFYNGRTVSEDQLVDSKSIGSTGCEVRFDDLPYGKYYIKETKANDDYILNGEVKYVDVPSANQWQAIEVEFSNEPTSIGTVAVDGKDGDHYVEASSKATIKDTIQYCVTPNKKYTIKGVLMNKETGEKLLVDGKPVESSVDINPKTSCGSVVMNFELDASALGGKEAVVFERLYEYKSDGDYDGEDPIVKHEDIDDPKQTIDIISLETVAEDGTDGDKEILADKTAVVKDTVSYCVKPGQKYTIRGILMDKSTGEPFLVNGEKIDGAVEIEPTEACGTAEMLFHFDATGLQGKELVVFEKLYIFGEDNPDDDEPIITHEDINDPKQTIDIISLETVAKDGTDGDKEILADKAAVVKDTVSYCVKPGQKYTIRGILMDKSTGEPLLVNGEKIEGAVEIEPTEACGTAEMLFHFDATGLQGKELVVFEKLYIFGEDNPDEDEPIITHEDINDENQAVIVYMPTPNTGRFTAKDGGGRIGEFILAPAAIVVVVGGYGIYRASARKRFLRRK